MNTRIKTVRWASVLTAAIVALPLAAQAQVSPEQNKLLAKRAAEADAYRKLAETVYGLQISSETYVRDFVTESDTIRTDLDTFVRGIRVTNAKWDSDGVCTVEAEVTVAKLIEELKAVHKRHYKGNVLKAADFEQIKQYYKKDIVKAYGMGAPRPDVPPDLGMADEPATASAPEPFIPAVWKAVPPQERLMAKRAAEVDAKRRLLERIKGLRITSDTLVRDFVAESDTITTEARGMLVGAREVGQPFYHHDELIVEVKCEVPVESVITTIKSLHKRHYKGDKVRAVDIENITQTIKSQTFDAIGMGVPRPQAIKIVEQSAQMDIPDWLAQTVTAEGQGVPREDIAGTPQGKLMAARAAELDAKRRLAEEIMGFQIDSSTTVRDFVTEHDEINSRLNTFIQGSYVKSTTYDGETATVVVEMPAAQIWEVVHTYVKIRRG